MTANRRRAARSVAIELSIEASLCVTFYCVVVLAQALDRRGARSAVAASVDLLDFAAGFALLTLAVRAVTHTPWHFWLRIRAARTHGFSWRRTYGWLAGTYALAYLVGIGATGGVLWESLIEQPVRIVLPSLAACLAAPYLTYKLLGETIDTLAAQGRPGAGSAS